MLSDVILVPPMTWSSFSLKMGLVSPVIIDSSTKVLPSIISPSLGILSPAYTRTSSPGFKLDDIILLSFPWTNLWADTSFSRFLRESTLALACDSDNDSENVANHTVSISIIAVST